METTDADRNFNGGIRNSFSHSWLLSLSLLALEVVVIKQKQINLLNVGYNAKNDAFLQIGFTDGELIYQPIEKEFAANHLARFFHLMSIEVDNNNSRIEAEE